jgi:hypothetical protein
MQEKSECYRKLFAHSDDLGVGPGLTTISKIGDKKI